MQDGQHKDIITADAASDTESGKEITPERFVFSGKAGEYFRIWIVNIFLTVITAGIYSAWAKVRTRRYFYANTTIDGHAFDYLANPVSILKGHLIIGVLFVAYMLSGNFYPQWAFVFIILFYLFFPYLMYKSIKFYTHNSAYRNIRFHFDGTLWESYQLFLLVPILIPLTLGAAFPYWEHLKKRWFFENSAFGTTVNDFNGRAGFFYKTYFYSFLQMLIIIAVFAGMAGVAAYSMGMVNQHQPPNMEMIVKKGLLVGAVMYVVMIFGFTMIQQYVFSRVTNYCWQQSRIGQVKVKSQLKFRKLFWIRLTNIIAIICSIGLLIPWAKVRRSRYILSCMSLEYAGSLEDLTEGRGSGVSAVGDAAADFFDFDFGL